MEKSEVLNTENCFVCNEYMGSFSSDLTVCSSYSERPIFQILELFINSVLSEDIITECGVCQNCFIKFNEYDEHQTAAQQIQNELINLLESKYDMLEQEQKVKIEEIEESTMGYEQMFTTSDDYAQEDDFVDSEQVLEEMIDGSTSDQFRYEVVIDEQNYIEIEKNQNEDDTKHESAQKLFPVAGYECNICKKSFKDSNKLKVHREIHTSERNVICEICDKSFKTMNCLRNHKRLHLERTYFQCDQCEKRYFQKIQLKKHVNIVHLNLREFKCQTCFSCFGTKSVLKTHMLSHQEFRQEQCQICGFRVHTKAKLRRHMKSHTGERNYECHLCHKKFLYSYNVVAHIRNVHSKESAPKLGDNDDKKPHNCEICGVKFWKLSKLNDHMNFVHQVGESYSIVYDNPTI